VAKPKAPKPKGSGRLAPPHSEGIDPNTLSVVFGFRHIARGFDLSGAAAKHAGQFVDALRLRSSITWAQIIGSPREKLGAEKIAAALKVPIPESVPERERTALLCFRFGGDMERFIGYRNGATFEVVLIDHCGAAYDHC
jgi:hypothetical protein